LRLYISLQVESFISFRKAAARDAKSKGCGLLPTLTAPDLPCPPFQCWSVLNRLLYVLRAGRPRNKYSALLMRQQYDSSSTRLLFLPRYKKEHVKQQQKMHHRMLRAKRQCATHGLHMPSPKTAPVSCVAKIQKSSNDWMRQGQTMRVSRMSTSRAGEGRSIEKPPEGQLHASKIAKVR